MAKSKIIKQEKNPFLEREELTIEINSEAAPSEEEVKKTIGKDEKLIVVKKVNTNFGRKKFIAEAVVYESEEAKKKVETVPQKVRKKMAEEEKAKKEAEKKAKEEEAKAKAEAEAEELSEPSSEEKPAEETKEEKPIESKPEEEKKE